MLTISRLKDVINKENTSITEKISNVFLMVADSDVSFCNGELTCFNKDNTVDVELRKLGVPVVYSMKAFAQEYYGEQIHLNLIEKERVENTETVVTE